MCDGTDTGLDTIERKAIEEKYHHIACATAIFSFSSLQSAFRAALVLFEGRAWARTAHSEGFRQVKVGSHLPRAVQGSLPGSIEAWVLVSRKGRSANHMDKWTIESRSSVYF